ncbi:beta-propeller fold lactonase family protein [Cellulomonas sp. HZM]|uniref:lactonase family protein n=1 Tax=Cellulomonas sp. HZM TaxID=1454010 RepID=UPI00068AFF3D|nr:beta-propeller fold lactonase family protein [Cellulomonas sp. HZM]
MTSLWIGTYPVAGAGTPVGLGEGVWRAELADDGTWAGVEQVAVTPSPSFLAAHPGGRVLYAANEQTDGTVTALVVDGDRVSPTATTPSGGADPCHLLLTPDAGTLLVANYSSGTLGAIPLAADGSFAGPVVVHGHTGHGPREDRQEGPHAHFVALEPDGEHVVVVDLGTDELRRYALTADGVLEAGIAASFDPGTGPRHLAFAPDGRHAYVAGELDSTLRVLAWPSGEVVQTLPLPEGLAAHVLLDGDEVVVAVRGPGVLLRFAVADDGLLAPLRTDDLPGTWPRHHGVVGGRLVVAEQVAGSLEVLDREGTVVDRVDVPAAACVVPVAGRSTTARRELAVADGQ